jgi:hypothetical protein
MSRVEKNVEGNKISCFSIDLILNIFPVINVYPKTATTKFPKSLSVFRVETFWPSHDNSKKLFLLCRGRLYEARLA